MSKEIFEFLQIAMLFGIMLSLFAIANELEKIRKQND